jgi:hypothetical protein
MVDFQKEQQKAETERKRAEAERKRAEKAAKIAVAEREKVIRMERELKSLKKQLSINNQHIH